MAVRHDTALEQLVGALQHTLGAAAAAVGAIDESDGFALRVVVGSTEWGAARLLEHARAALAENATQVRTAGQVATCRLVCGGEVLGLLVVERPTPVEWTAHERETVQRFAGVAADMLDLRRRALRAHERFDLLRAMLDSAGDGLLAIAESGEIIIGNPVATTVLGLPGSAQALPEDWCVRHDVRTADGAAVTSPRELLTQIAARDGAGRMLVSLSPPGSTRRTWVELCGRPVVDSHGVRRASITVLRDVSEQVAHQNLERELAARLGRSEQLLRAILAQLPNAAMFAVDREMRYIAADGPLKEELLQRSGVYDDVVGRKVTDVFDADRAREYSAYYELAYSGRSVVTEYAGEGRSYEMTSVPIFEDGTATHAMLFIYDVTERERQRAFLNTALDTITDGVVVLRPDGGVATVNKSYLELFELSHAEAMALVRSTFLERACRMAKDPDHFRAAFERVDAEYEIELEIERPARRILRRRWVPLPNDMGTLVTWRDVTAQHDMLAERERLALVDALTRIPNRRSAEHALGRGRDRAHRGYQLSVVLFDIDHFKSVNDRFGHGMGDLVIQRVAQVIESCARTSDTVARWGGEEFIGVLETDLEGARVFAERVRAAVSESTDGAIPAATISAGVAQLGADDDVQSIVARADQMLYAAKRAGRNRVVSDLDVVGSEVPERRSQSTIAVAEPS